MEIQNSSVQDFLLQRQQARKEYFQTKRSADGSEEDGTSTGDTSSTTGTNQSAVVLGGSLASSSSGTTSASTANVSAKTSTTTSTDATDTSTALKDKYGSFYQTSPNGDKLAELRARNESMMSKYTNPTS